MTFGQTRRMDEIISNHRSGNGPDLGNSERGPLFDPPRSASSLYRPDIEAFLAYSSVFYEQHHFTNSGPVSRLLEGRLAEFHNVRYCVSMASGFWALVLAMKALALPEKSEVVMPSLTYRRMADVAAWAGLVPRFCDSDPETLAISAATAAPCTGAETALLLAVHPIVNCCDVEGLEGLAADLGVPLLIDGVESCYETFRGRKVGSFGSAEVFSLHASKLINGFEGGYVTTNDGDLAERLWLMRGFGFNGHDNVEHMGINAKLNEIHAAMALACLDELDRLVDDNRRRYLAYRQHLADVPGLRLLEFDESERCSFKNIVVELCDGWPLTRSDTLSLLHGQGVLARPYYSPALHQKTTTYPTRHGPLPVTEWAAERFMLLPCGDRVSEGDVAALAALLSDVAAGGRVRVGAR